MPLEISKYGLRFSLKDAPIRRAPNYGRMQGATPIKSKPKATTVQANAGATFNRPRISHRRSGMVAVAKLRAVLG